MRRSLLLAVVLSLVAAAPASATHLPGFGPTCGAAGDVLLESAGPASANFRTDGSSSAGVTGAQANALMEEVRTKLVSEFGWADLPRHADLANRYYARFGPANQSGVQTTGDYTGQAGSDPNRRITCLVLPANANLDALKPFVARELAKAVWYGMGALVGEGAAPAWLREGGAELMEDEVFPADTPDELPPDWDSPLRTYPDASAQRAWLILRGIAEPLGAGTGAAGGVEDVLQVAFERQSARSHSGVDALAVAVAAKGSTVESAFHQYALAARFMKGCTAPRSYPCFVDGPSYGGAPASHEEVADTGASHEGSVPAGLALRWVDLPVGPYDVRLTGGVTGTIACDAGTAITTVALPVGERVRNVSCGAGERPVLVVTSGAAAGDAPVAYKLEFLPATALLTILRFGEGLVGSAPAGIECGLVCTAAFELGTKVTLGAQPKLGHTFAGWSGDCSGTAICEITMDRDRSVGAGFAPPKAPAGPPTGPGGGSSDDTTAPRLLIAKPRITRGRKKIRVELTCPADEASSCTGPVGLKLRVGKKRYSFDGEALVRLRPGRSRVLSYAFSSKERSRLRRVRRVRVTVSVRARDEAFNTLTTTRTYKRVRVPRR